MEVHFGARDLVPGPDSKKLMQAACNLTSAILENVTVCHADISRRTRARLLLMASVNPVVMAIISRASVAPNGQLFLTGSPRFQCNK